MTRVECLASVRKLWSVLSVCVACVCVYVRVCVFGEQEKGGLKWRRSSEFSPPYAGATAVASFSQERTGFSREKPEKNFVQDAGGFSYW